MHGCGRAIQDLMIDSRAGWSKSTSLIKPKELASRIIQHINRHINKSTYYSTSANLSKRYHPLSFTYQVFFRSPNSDRSALDIKS